ncbi:MAG: hemolysin family protein [Stappiaceae bacterium]
MNDPEARSPEADQARHTSQDIAEPDGAEKSVHGPTRWIDRLKKSVGLYRNGSLRENLENELSREVGDPGAIFSPEERMLLGNILRLREVRVEDVMVPRADIIAAEHTITLGKLMDAFRESGHSRMPVFHETLDDPRGMVHVKDVMAYVFECGVVLHQDYGPGTKHPAYALEKVDLGISVLTAGLIRPVLFVPPSMPAADLMAKMQASRMQMALVIDEYGGTDGLVSLEDLVETVVGDIVDEHDDEQEPMIEPQGEGIWLADARVDIDDAREILGKEFNAGDQEEEIDTLGGLLFTLVGRIPVRGEMIASASLPGFEFEVIDADPRRIKRMKIYRRRADQRFADARRVRRLSDNTSKHA